MFIAVSRYNWLEDRPAVKIIRIFAIILIIFIVPLLAYSQSSLGGLIYLVHNHSGATMYRGQLVVGDSTSTIAAGPVAGVAFYTEVDTCPKGSLYCFGTVYSESIVSAGYGFITTSGRGYVAVQYDRAVTVIPAGDRILTVSADSARKANCEKSTSVVTHFLEIGQPVTKLYGKNAHGDSICIADIHKL